MQKYENTEKEQGFNFSKGTYYKERNNEEIFTNLMFLPCLLFSKWIHLFLSISIPTDKQN